MEEFGKIREQEVFEAITCGEIIKEYENDKPYPSMLIYHFRKLKDTAKPKLADLTGGII